MAEEFPIAKRVRQYIDARPVIRDALQMGIVNLSELARVVMEDTGILKLEAVAVACRRYQDSLQDARPADDVLTVLKRSRIEIKTRIALVTLRSSTRTWNGIVRLVQKAQQGMNELHVLSGADGVTLIFDEDLIPQVEELAVQEGQLRDIRGLAELNVRCPPDVTEVPGILAYLTSALAGQGINVIDVIGCHRDNIFVMQEDEVLGAMKRLKELMGSGR